MKMSESGFSELEKINIISSVAQLKYEIAKFDISNSSSLGFCVSLIHIFTQQRLISPHAKPYSLKVGEPGCLQPTFSHS